MHSQLAAGMYIVAATIRHPSEAASSRDHASELDDTPFQIVQDELRLLLLLTVRSSSYGLQEVYRSLLQEVAQSCVVGQLESHGLEHPQAHQPQVRRRRTPATQQRQQVRPVALFNKLTLTNL